MKPLLLALSLLCVGTLPSCSSHPATEARLSEFLKLPEKTQAAVIRGEATKYAATALVVAAIVLCFRPR